MLLPYHLIGLYSDSLAGRNAVIDCLTTRCEYFYYDLSKHKKEQLIDEPIWARHIEENLRTLDYSKYNGIVLSDISHIKEAQWIKKHNGIVIFVKQKDLNEKHTTKQDLYIDFTDFVIYDSESTQDLYRSIEVVLNPYRLWELWENEKVNT